MKNTRDLTTGSILKNIIYFALPLFIGMLFQQFYNLADALIVGNYLGVDAFSGVGSTGNINFLVIGLCNGVASGCAIPVAQKFGSKDYSSLRKYVTSTLYLGIGFTIILSFVSCLLCDDMLRWMSTLDNVYQYAYDYIFVIFLGIPITFAYNALSGIVRSLGDSKTPVYILVIAIVLNIILDIIFICLMRKGVIYAAVATVISQLFASICTFIVMVKKFDILKMEKEDWKFSPHRIYKLSLMGLPMGIQYSITALGAILLTAAVNNLNSTVYIAAISAFSKLGGFFCTPFDALGATMATYAGQNIGAKKYENLSKGLWTASLIGCIYAVIIFGVCWFFGGEISMIFLNNVDESMYKEILEACRLIARIVSAFYIPLVFINTVRFFIQGMGHSSFAMIAGVLEMIGRAVIALVFTPKFGFIAVCFASPLAWILGDLFLIPAFIYLKNKLIKNNISKENKLA